MQPPTNQEPQPSREEKLQAIRESMRPYLWQGGKWRPAFRRTAILISLIVNFVLVIALLIVAQQLFAIKTFADKRLFEGLYYNFVLMDRAHIRTEIIVSDSIQVSDTIPVVFDLPLQQGTEVILNQDTPIKNATIYLNNQPVPLDLTLRAGTPLHINLDLTVPVSQTVPVVLDVPVNLKVPIDIPLKDTELHEPFIGLQDVISPYYWMLHNLPETWENVPFCQGWLRSLFCDLLLIPE
jgi:hypothetical protein